jgi:ribonuclease HI
MSESKIVQLYTDGSGNNATDRIGSIGIVLLYGDYRKMFQEGFVDTTNNRTELLAVIRGFQIIKNKNIHVELYCDSAYVLNCLKDKWYYKWRQGDLWRTSSGDKVENIDLWKELLHEYEKFPKELISFHKVKGHSGDRYNCLCDHLAKEANREVQATGKPFPLRERLIDDKIHYDLEFTKSGTIRKQKKTKG